MRQTLWSPKGFWRPFVYRAKCALRIKDSASAIAVGVACGVFVSFTPLMGLHIALAVVLAWLLGGNIVASVIGTAVGNPLSFPFIWLLTYRGGSWALGRGGGREETASNFGAEVWRMISERSGGLGEALINIGENFIWPMMVGGVPLGLLAAFVAYWLTKPTVAAFQDARDARRERLAARRRAKAEAIAAEASGEGSRAPSGGSAPVGGGSATA